MPHFRRSWQGWPRSSGRQPQASAAFALLGTPTTPDPDRPPESWEALDASGRRIFALFPLAVAAVMVDPEGRILLFESASGIFEVPSGAVEAGETILDAVDREIREECGPQVAWRPLGVVHAYTLRYDEIIDRLVSIIYLVAYDGGEVVPSDDASGSAQRWVGRDELDAVRDRVMVPSEPWVLDRALELWAIWR